MACKIANRVAATNPMVSCVKVLEQSAEALFVPCRIGLDSLLERRNLSEPILDRQGNEDEGRV